MAAVGVQTITYARPRGIGQVSWAWTSDASGNVSGVDTESITGEILRVVTNPGATAPTDNYDVVVNDADGVDVLAGTGANRDTATSEQAIPIIETTVGANTYGYRVVVDGPLTLGITNAGATKQGTVTLYYR